MSAPAPQMPLFQSPYAIEREPGNVHANHVLRLVRRDRGEVKGAVEALGREPPD